MARSRKHPPTRRAGASRRPGSQRAPHPTAAERHLLELAREITGLPFAAALEKLTAAWSPSGALPRDVAQAWLRSRSDKTAALALAWAREQVRLALAEGLAAASTPQPDTLAWLLLAACESLAHEPPSAVADRVRSILDLSGRAAARG